jgi:putative nucleotidyltransferase with HDIG domain
VGTLSPDLEKKLGMAVERMPAFPKSVQKILEMTRNINCLPKDLVGVIEKDPVMTMKVLRVINSAYYSLPNKITSVSQSVVYLGLNTVKNLALAFAAVGILPRMNAAGFDIQRYLLHSLTTAAIARQLCNQYAKGEADPGDCYIAGLLHDFGKVVLAQYLAPEFREVLTRAYGMDGSGGMPLHVAEREIIGVDHGFIGARLAERWQFPEHLVDVIRHHHSEDQAPDAMMECLRVANQISRMRELGDAGNPWLGDEPCAAPARFGDDLERVILSLGDLQKIVDDAMAFAQVGAER